MTDEENLETQIRGLAGGFRYPDTPDLSRRGVSPVRSPVRRLAWAAAFLVILALLAFAVPPVRAALVEILGIGAVEIRLGEITPAVPKLDIDLPGETTLEAARSSSEVHLPLPGDLGNPDRVFVLSEVGNTAVLVWETESVALYVIPPGPIVQKLAPESVRQATVRGVPAIWTRGDHFLELVSGDPDLTIFVESNVLIWTEDGVTYRLESTLPLDETLELAETLQ